MTSTGTEQKLMLKISESVYSQIRKHGEETYPHECCGVLLGKALEGANEVEEAIRAGNTRTDSAHNRYHIAPQELISIQRWPGSVISISWAFTTPIRTIRRAGHRPISTKPIGLGAPT